MTNAHTKWTLLPGPGGWTYVEYYVYSDPGGSLPDWLVNMALDVGPRETIKNMRSFVRQEKYQRIPVIPAASIVPIAPSLGRCICW